MISYEMGKVSQKARLGFYNLLSPEGKKYLAELYESELQILNNFQMSYSTPDLRRLERKVEKGTADESEIKILKKNKKSFQGVLNSGGVIKDEDAIKVISDYLEAKEIIEVDLKHLKGSDTEDVKDNAQVILGRPIAYWNLHPNLFTPAMFRELYQSPEYVRDEINKMIILKATNGEVVEQRKVFDNIKEIQEVLRDVKTEEYFEALVVKLAHLNYLEDSSSNTFKTNLLNLINLLIEEDRNFDFKVYQKVKQYLPQYHNQKLRYMITLICQHNHVGTTEVSHRIEFLDLYAMYRKADELC